jgi:hypothetical protein
MKYTRYGPRVPKVGPSYIWAERAYDDTYARMPHLSMSMYEPFLCHELCTRLSTTNGSVNDDMSSGADISAGSK